MQHQVSMAGVAVKTHPAKTGASSPAGRYYVCSGYLLLHMACYLTQIQGTFHLSMEIIMHFRVLSRIH